MLKMKLRKVSALLTMLFISCYLVQSGNANGRGMSAYDFSFVSIGGEPMPFSNYKSYLLNLIN